MSDDLKPCPFCGNVPWFEGSGEDWKDNHRYIQMHLVCCISMSSAIGWQKARDMVPEARTKEMKDILTQKWNTRFVVEDDEKDSLS
jgi:hypothetical protein